MDLLGSHSGTGLLNQIISQDPSQASGPRMSGDSEEMKVFGKAIPRITFLSLQANEENRILWEFFLSFISLNRKWLTVLGNDSILLIEIWDPSYIFANFCPSLLV